MSIGTADLIVAITTSLCVYTGLRRHVENLDAFSFTAVWFALYLVLARIAQK